MPFQKTKFILLLPLLLLLFTGYSCSPSLDTLVKRARAAAKDAPPRSLDTVTIVLPGLLLFKEDAAAHNATSFDIVCLDKRGIFTNTLAEIERCECQLYQKEGGKIRRMRLLWTAEPLDNWTWSRVYFDETGKPKMKDKLKVTSPYKFVSISNKRTWSSNFIHEEITMYFEMTVIR